ncbi:Dopey, N-terminal-domain-containing protein, partial [Hygrophoropsis aurantiaca]
MSSTIKQVDGASATSSSTKTGERVATLNAVSSDPKFKKYMQQVEKCLNAFDNVHEWADCIAFLKQLLKTFQSYPQFKEIPHKLVVAKRLAQCLNPALPTGVHQRALDVYTYILSVVGTEGLKRDLPLWSSGLFPFFEYAATSVKPTLLTIYESNYLPLQAGLRPIMKSFILALLPGLEEETGEFFERVLSLLDRLSGTVSPVFFIQNIWLIISTMPTARGTALNFLSRRLPRLHADEDITQIVGRDIGLMIRAFAVALEDDNLLVRRGALDILLQSMRIDSAAIKRARPEDCAILMRAATGVVLRRDLSLNRRLYTWLLGPDEKSESQFAYLRQHGLQLLSSTLKDEMFSPSGEYSESRPFKIFISLLDKWEIGSCLTEVLILDAIRAIRRLIDVDSENREDVVMTASTLYEAVEPSILWKHMLISIMKDISGDGTQSDAINLALFILRTLPVHDEEVRSLHLPVILAAVMEAVKDCVREDDSRISSTSVRTCMVLQEEILRHILPEALYQRPELKELSQEFTTSLNPLSFAYAIYGIQTPQSTSPSSDSYERPLTTVLGDTMALCLACSRDLLGRSDNSASTDTLAVFSHVLLVLAGLIEITTNNQTNVDVLWDPVTWLPSVLDSLELETMTFPLVDQIVSQLITLHQSSAIQPALSIDNRHTIRRMIKKIFKFLHPNWVIYHVRAVNLIWSLEATTGHSHVESVIAQSMTSPESRNVYDSYEAFGVLWRLTEDDLLPGVRLKVPMTMVLETLKHDNPNLRRVGETWMRCSLKSYMRVVEPILFDLLDPSIRRTPKSTRIQGREIQGFIYEQPFDQRYVNHLLEILLSIVHFGGQGFAKTTRTTPVGRSHHQALLYRLDAAGINSDMSYLDVLIEVLLRFLQSEPKDQRATVMQPWNSIIQSTAVDLLQAIVARGEIDDISVEAVEPAIIGKLFFCIHLNRLDLQNKLLRILHSLISAATSNLAKATSPKGVPSEDQTSDGSQEHEKKSYTVNPLLIQTLADGISVPQNRAVLQHWLDFVLMALSQFQIALQVTISPVADCLCRQLRSGLQDALDATDRTRATVPAHMATDAEFMMLLNALERLLVLGLARRPEIVQEDDSTTQDKPANETSGLLGYVSNVFTTESNSPPQDDQLSIRPSGYRSLHEGVRTLYSIWQSMIWIDPLTPSAEDDTLSLIFLRTRGRSRRALEHLFRVQPTEVFESIIDCWDRETSMRSQNSAPSNDAVFELVDVLVANVHTSVHMVCESISGRNGTPPDRFKKSMNPNLSDVVLFKFLEQYLQRLEGPLALQVWGRFLQLARDLVTNIREFKVQVFLVLKCLCVLGEKVTQTTAIEDRRIKKDLQETFGKLLDTCVTFVGRSADIPTWIKRTAKDALSTTNGRSSPAPRAVSEIKIDEKLNSSSTSLQDTTKPVWNAELPVQICLFIASTILPNLRKFLMDSDKITSACSNIVYYIINPSIKLKARPLEVDPVIADMIREMTKLPPALKVWRSPVVDLLYDNRIFNSNPLFVTKWKPVIRVLFDSDKTAFTELLSRIATAPSANIFTNREHEMQLRSLNLRRLSLVLFTGEKNHFLTQLPVVQEKLVDILRNVPSPVVQSEVYLCIRILLCRLSPHNLTSFWPVILTEMYRVFEQIITTIPSDGSEDLQLVLAASKCLDLLLALQTEEFQIHQWMFITDTVDAVYRSDDWHPNAMMDLLAEVIGSLPVPEVRERSKSRIVEPTTATSTSFGSLSESRSMRRPMLNSLRQIDSIRDLIPFFSNVSAVSYESVYASSGNVDWEAVEQGILNDIFDAR